MSVVLKFLLFTLFFLLVCFAGLAIYRKINRKIIESKNYWALAGFTALLGLSLGILFMGSLAVLIEVYRFLVLNK